MHPSSFNFINTSHASFSLFLLPTHNSTYHLTSTTKDLGTNLGFKTSSFALVEEHLNRITNNTLINLVLKLRSTKLNLKDDLTLMIFLAALADEGDAEIGRKKEERDGT